MRCRADVSRHCWLDTMAQRLPRDRVDDYMVFIGDFVMVQCVMLLSQAPVIQREGAGGEVHVGPVIR
jgi:hypothetical protein